MRLSPLSQTLNKKTVKESPSVLLSRPPPRTRAPERRADETLKHNSPWLRSTSINHARGLRATLARTNPGLLLGPGLTQGTLSEAYISPPRQVEIRTPFESSLSVNRFDFIPVVSSPSSGSFFEAIQSEKLQKPKIHTVQE